MLVSWHYIIIIFLSVSYSPVRMSFTRFIPPVHLVHSSSRTKGRRTGVKWGEWWTRGMNGSEPRDERNMGSIDSWIPFVSLRHPRSLSLISLPVGDGSEDERSEPSASRSLRSRYAEGMEGNDVRKGPNMTSRVSDVRRLIAHFTGPSAPSSLRAGNRAPSLSSFHSPRSFVPQLVPLASLGWVWGG